ncbi:MAG: hypothetical protein RLZZ306_2938 [Bacteroidota bacterium]|jgi:hypothetical protein
MDIKLPVDYFLTTIEERKVYYFTNQQLNTEVPHYHICIKRKSNDFLILSSCTSKFETVKRFIEMRKLPFETLVHLKPSDENGFTKDTYVNCNDYHIKSIDDFKKMYESDSIEFKGKISITHYEQILIGLHESPLIEEEMKEDIPRPEDI